MNIGKYIKELFIGNGIVDKKKVELKTQESVKEVPVLLPIPASFIPSSGSWDYYHAENLERFLNSDTGVLFQQYILCHYGKVLAGSLYKELGQNEYQYAKGIASSVGLIRQLAVPTSYADSEVLNLSRVNTNWDSGITPRKK